MTQPQNNPNTQGGGGQVNSNAEATPEQVNTFHRYSDKDTHPDAQHHSLGIDPNQASPGDHNHNGQNSLPISGTAVGSSGSVGLPTGTVILAAATAIPTGYLLCNGAYVSQVTYSQLFNVITNYYGPADPNNFALPSMPSVGSGAPGTSTAPVRYFIKT